jgi:hypothetical protein
MAGDDDPDRPVETDAPADEPFDVRIESLTVTPISYAWIPVLSEETTVYHFPEPITGFMRDVLRQPAVFRWKVTSPHSATEYFIGETEELCPRGIYQYLKPGASQPEHQRLNALFLSRIKHGASVTIDFLGFAPFSVGEIAINQESLADPHVRALVEELVIVVMNADEGTGSRD